MSSGEQSGGGSAPTSRYVRPEGLQNLFGQVDETKEVMKSNMEKVMEREAKLQELDTRAAAMHGEASKLSGQSGAMKK